MTITMKKSLSLRKFALTTKMSSRKLLRSLSTMSINSTQSVENNTKADLSRPKKTVQFNEADNEWYYPEDKNGNEVKLSQKDVEKLWYTANQLTAFRQDTMRVAAKWAKQADGTPSAMAKNLTKAYEVSSSSSQTVKHLRGLQLGAPHMVGLEGSIVRKKSGDDRKERLTKAVLQHAATDDVEKLRSVSVAQSKASAWFAAQIALQRWTQEHPQP